MSTDERASVPGGRAPGDGAPGDQALMWNIHRAAHFQWREAAMLAFGHAGNPEKGLELVQAYWRVVGRDTGRAWLREIDPEEPLAPQVSALIARASEIMGETAHATADGFEHTACPWAKWHARYGLSHEDRPGCDAWIASTLASINAALGSNLRFETIQTLPEGAPSCLRRVWEEGR